MKNQTLTRRNFLTAAATAAAATAFSTYSAEQPRRYGARIRKAMIVGKVTENTLRPLHEAGFDGVETTHICPEEEAAEGRAVAEKLGMRVHSVLRGWMEFNSESPEKVENSLEQTRKALHAAHAYRADTILLVPCRVGGMAIPEPWEFDVEFDPGTGHVTRVVAGDNTKYEAYIAAQNRATDTSKAAVKKLIPMAEELKVIIALENVWNNLWVTPALFQNFVASFNHPWVKAYYDIGNHVKYSPPQLWVKTLGPLIAKLHVKDFKLKPDGHGGEFVHPRDGSIDWPAVRAALDQVGYHGWATIEDGGLPLKEFARRFDLIEAGV